MTDILQHMLGLFLLLWTGFVTSRLWPVQTHLLHSPRAESVANVPPNIPNYWLRMSTSAFQSLLWICVNVHRLHTVSVWTQSFFLFFFFKKQSKKLFFSRWKRHVNVALVSRVHSFISSQFTRRSSQNTPHTFWHTPTHLLAELHQSLQSVCMEADMDSCHSSHLTRWLTVCACVCVFQGHCHLWHRFWCGVPDGCGGGLVPVPVHVHEEWARGTCRRVQNFLRQHCDPGLSR